MSDQDHPLADYLDGYQTPPQYRNISTGWLRLVPISGMDAPNVISLADRKAQKQAASSSAPAVRPA
jgi:hypothetical protein